MPHHKHHEHHKEHTMHHKGHHSGSHHGHHDHHHSGHSHKNTSMGGHGVGNTGADYVPIKEYHDPHPPAGAHNSYEKVREKIDRKDESSLRHRPYTREKMMNK